MSVAHITAAFRASGLQRMKNYDCRSLCEWYLQAAVVSLNEWMLVFAPVASLWSVWMLYSCKWLWWTVPLYFAWYVYDFNASKRGSHLSWRVRRSRFFQYFVDYFPITLRKTADLDPKRNYVIGCHPHGIMSIGTFGNFLTDATKVSQLFPGITPYLCTLVANFVFPFRREYIELQGVVDCSKESIAYLLNNNHGGNAVVIVVGGAEEALESHPGSYKVVLRKRRGFLKLALQYGAAVVPAYSFGEVDTFDQISNPKGSWLRTIQDGLRKWITCSTPLFYGCGMSGKGFGFLPYRRPICTVVGAPIEVEKNVCPTKEQVDDLHKVYVSQLCKLFENHKRSFGIADNCKLEIV